MEKSKLGIPVPVLAAVCGLLCLYGGYLIAGLLVGYVLLKEEDLELKRTCAEFFLVMLAFSVAGTVLNLIPNLLHLLYSFLEIFNVHFYINFIHGFFSFLSSVLNLAETLLLLFLSGMALLGRPVKIAPLDNLVKKYIN